MSQEEKKDQPLPGPAEAAPVAPDSGGAGRLVLVTAARGFVGREVISRLLRKGFRVRALVRRQEGGPLPAGVEVRRADLAAAKTLEEVCDGCYGLLHLSRGFLAPAATLKALHVSGTRALVRQAERSAVRRFVYLSELGLPEVTEEKDKPPGVYFKCKYEAEKLVEAARLESYILRTSWVYGPGDCYLERVARRLRQRLPFLGMVASGGNLVQPIHLDDLVSALCAPLQNKELATGTYRVAGPETLPLLRVIERVQRVLGRNKVRLHLPGFLAVLLSPLLGALFPAVFSREALRLWMSDSCAAKSDTHRLLGRSARALEEGLQYLEQ